MLAQVDPLELVRSSLDAALAGGSETGEVVLSTGYTFGDGEPVLVHVRKRGRRINLHDGGDAVRRAGKPRGWLELAEEVVAAEGLNVNRAGAVFVPVVEGGDLAALATRLAGCALDVHAALLELRDAAPR